MLQSSERAERVEDRAERARLMTIVVVGGGPPGVAMAVYLVEITDFALASWSRPVRAC
jgi:NADH dehydrogenase